MPTPAAVWMSVTPMVPTGGSLADALKFYTEQLGFTVVWEHGQMAGIRRNTVSFNLVENNNRQWIENSSYSVGVSDLDALFEEYRGASLNVGPLEMKAWKRREFHMIVPSGVCFQFYEQPD